MREIMQRRVRVFSVSALLLGLVLAVFPPGGEVLSQSEPMFVAKGSFWVSGPLSEVERVRTNVGQRLSAKSKGKLRVIKVDAEASLSGKKLDLESPELKSVIQAIADSITAAFFDNSSQVRKQTKTKGASPEVTVNAKATVKNPLISFVLTGTSRMEAEPSSAKEGPIAKQGDEAKGEGAISNLSTRVKELRPLNGKRIYVTAKAHVDEVDAIGVARVRVDFEMRSAK